MLALDEKRGTMYVVTRPSHVAIIRVGQNQLSRRKLHLTITNQTDVKAAKRLGIVGMR